MLETLPYSLQESNFVVSLTVKKLNAVPISNCVGTFKQKIREIDAFITSKRAKNE